MALVKIDNAMLVEDLYRLRALLDDPEAARQKITEILQLISDAPLCEQQSRFPKSAGWRGV